MLITNTINAIIAASNPFTNLSIVSLNDRIKLMQYLSIPNLEKYNSLSIGQKIVKSNTDIIKYFSEAGITNNARTISVFCYSSFLKSKWKQDKKIDNRHSYVAIEDDELSFPEGKEKFNLHLSKERNNELVKVAKKIRLKSDPNLCCEVCEFSFVEKYGELGEGFIEAHHLMPISKLTQETQTKIKDLALVCPNCHRMLHRKRPWLALSELKNLLK